MSWDAADVRIILDELGRWRARALEPQVANWAQCLAAPVLSELMTQLTALGVLSDEVSAGLEPDVPGLWRDLTDPHAIALGVGILSDLGQGNAALALACHRRALGLWLLHQMPDLRGAAQPPVDAGLALVMTGHHGLAQHSLGRWLAGAGLAPDDTALLSDWLDRDSHETQLWSPHGWQQLLWPVWCAGTVQWARMWRSDLIVQTGVAPYGLQELHTARVRTRCGSAAWVSDLSAERSRQLYAEVLTLDMIGLMAIGLGVLRCGRRLAHDFAHLRRQGGAVIARHPAVQTMLSDLAATEHTVDGLLQSLHHPLAQVSLARVASARLHTADLLVQANHQAIQVHGGVGYMRDVGPEKLVRDQTMLRLATGGVRALPLLLHGLQEMPS